jgi:S-adenosylmethionine synthetase
MLKTAECVSPKHPDKICDQISDAILDACLEQDPDSRVAIETMGGHGIITICGEMTTKAFVDCQKIARQIVGQEYGIQVNIVQQSPDIARGVDVGGAGDQGIMIGYACNENESMIPQELFLARSLCQHIYASQPFDGKTQITLNDENEIVAIVASFAKTASVQLEKLVATWININDLNTPANIFLNPAGDWDVCGFEADTGLTGRKLAVDNYGPRVPIGGGCFSGKDATKVDRSAAYMARRIAVDILKSTNAKEVLVKLAYSIGVAEPVMAVVAIEGVEKIIERNNLEPKEIIKFLDLKRPQFQKTAEWGHFGNGFIWDK